MNGDVTPKDILPDTRLLRDLNSPLGPCKWCPDRYTCNLSSPSLAKIIKRDHGIDEDITKKVLKEKYRWQRIKIE
jgi:hypothetical protein